MGNLPESEANEQERKLIIDRYEAVDAKIEELTQRHPVVADRDANTQRLFEHLINRRKVIEAEYWALIQVHLNTMMDRHGTAPTGDQA